MSEFFGVNLELGDFERLLKKDEFEEEPVPVQVFVEDKKYLGLKPLSIIQTEMVERSTQIYHEPTLIKLYGEEEGKRRYAATVNEVICQLGKGSGKDHCARVSMAYTLYKLHCLSDPIDYYGKAHGVYIDLINLAVNAAQAQNVFFQPLKNLLLRSPYFNEVGFEPRVSELFFYSKPIRCFSGHSESEGWEGHDVMIVVLDEIAAFKTDAELKGETRSRHSASAIYNMSKLSVISRFPSVGKVILLSFPRYQGDFIQQRYQQVITAPDASQGTILDNNGEPVTYYEGHKIWSIKAATWQVNPTIKREDLESEFQRDPVQARARFMCEPPEMEDAFFRNPGQVRAAFKITEPPVDEDGRFKEWFNGRDGYPRFIHVDLALKRDRAALAMVHHKGFKKVETLQGEEKLPVIQLDLIKYWEAGFQEEINFASIRHYILELNKKFNVAGVWFDKWQCIPADTIVHTNYGQLNIHEIQQLLSLGREVLVESTAGPQKITSLSSNGEAPLVQIKTKLGFSVKLTDNHPVLTPDGWVEPSMLSVGDKVKIKVPTVSSNLSYCSEDEAVALGYMVSEGYYYEPKYQIKFTSVDEDSLDDVTNAMKHIVFNYTPKRTVRWESDDRRQKAWEITWNSKQALSRLKDLGWIGGSFTEEIPWVVRQSHSGIQRAFLASLFEGDGGCQITHGKYPEVYYDTRSETLNRQIQMMLLSFGIIATWYQDFRYGAERYRLYIRGDNARKFITEIGFRSSRKRNLSEKLMALPRPSKSAPRWRFDNEGYLSVPIIEISSYEKEEVFDIEVENGHSFTANGFMTHNSADMIQTLNSQGIFAEWQGVMKKDYDSLTTAFYDGRIHGYWDDATERLVEEELLKLKLINNTKVDHPVTGYKDGADALAGAVHQCMSVGGEGGTAEIEILITSDITQDDIPETIREISKPKRTASLPQATMEMPSEITDWLEGLEIL